MDPNNTIAAPAGPLAAANQALAPVSAVNPGDAELVAQWQTRLRQGETHDENIRKRYAEDRKVARGESDWLVDTNLVGAILEILGSFVYAKDPDFDVRVSESVNNTRAAKLSEATDTLRIVTSRVLRDAGLKRKAKRWVRSAMTVGAGWLKPALATRTHRDPVVQSEINSLQENLQRLAVLEANLAEGEVCDELAAKAEIEANLVALQAKLERQVATGLVLDFFAPDDVQVSPECGELVNYLESPWIAYRTYKSKTEAQAITGWSAEQMKSATVYLQRERKGRNSEALPGVVEWIKATDPSAETTDGFVCFREIWSRRDGVVYTLIEGVNDRWARDPFAPVTGSRFYDGFLLGFHYIDGERHPQSDVHQLKSLQDEYGRTRSNFANHRMRSVPYNVWDAGEVDPKEMDKLNNAAALENIAIDFKGSGGPMQNRVMRMSATPIDPAQYSTQPITVDMEKVSGAQDAMQSGVAVEKTATEAQIQNTGFGARVGSRRDEIEDVLSELGLWTAQVLLQVLPEDVVVRIAGIDAVWPKLTVDEVMEGFDIQVKAGSTGKPNLAADRAAWSTLLPLIEKMITVVGNFRMQGPMMDWAAKPYVAMLTRTFELLGMPDDVEKYLPKPDPAAVLLANAAAGAAPVEGGEEGAPAAGGPMQPQLDVIGTPAGTEPPITSPT